MKKFVLLEHRYLYRISKRNLGEHCPRDRCERIHPQDRAPCSVLGGSQSYGLNKCQNAGCCFDSYNNQCYDSSPGNAQNFNCKIISRFLTKISLPGAAGLRFHEVKKSLRKMIRLRLEIELQEFYCKTFRKKPLHYEFIGENLFKWNS